MKAPPESAGASDPYGQASDRILPFSVDGLDARGRVVGTTGDVARPADIRHAYDATMKAFGKIDIVVNNAGTFATGAFEKLTDEVLQHDFDQKLFAAIRLTRLVRRLVKYIDPSGACLM